MPIPGVSRILLVATTVGVALLALSWNKCSQCHSACPYTDKDDSRSGYLNYDCAGKPHQSSWSTWFHPERVWSRDGHNVGYSNRAGAVTRDWNILYHLGGVGPWVEKTIDVLEGGIAVPDGCEVEQVHMVRFPQRTQIR
jgi:acid phosphatase